MFLFYGRRVIFEIIVMKVDVSKKLLKKKKGDFDIVVVKVEFDEEFSGVLVEGVGEEVLILLVFINKGFKFKREKKEFGIRVRKIFILFGKFSVKKVKKWNFWLDDEFKLESDLEEIEFVVILRDFLFRRVVVERFKYIFDFLEEEDDDVDDDDDDNNDLEELKVKIFFIINDGEDEFVFLDGLDKDEYIFLLGKLKVILEKFLYDKKSQDFGNFFLFFLYFQKLEDDLVKFDSNEEDFVFVFLLLFGLKQIDKVLSKIVVVKKGKLFLDIVFKFKRVFKQKKVVEVVNLDLDLEFGILKKIIILKGKG